MGDYIEQALRDGEQLRHEAHLSLWSLATGFISGALVLSVSILCVYFLSWERVRLLGYLASAVLLVAGITILIQTLARYYTTELAVTNKRVIAKRGWVSRTTVELLLHKVESVQVIQTAVQRLCGYGDIIISAAGEENATITGISNPIMFRDEYYEAEEAMVRASQRASTADGHGALPGLDNMHGAHGVYSANGRQDYG